MWNRIFNSKMPAADLDLFRQLYCLTIFALSFGRLSRHAGLIETAGIDTSQYFYYHLHFAGVESWWILKLIFQISILAAGVGIAKRASLLTAFFSYALFAFPIDSQFHPYDSNIVFYVLMILAFAPGIQHGKDEREVPAWPRTLIIATLASVYLSAGLNKILFMGGPGWLTGESLRATLYQFYFLNQHPITLYVAQRAWLCQIFALASVVTELSLSLLVLDRKKWRQILVPLGLCLHFAIFLVMRVEFYVFFCPIYLIFLKRRHLKYLGLGALTAVTAGCVSASHPSRSEVPETLDHLRTLSQQEEKRGDVRALWANDRERIRLARRYNLNVQETEDLRIKALEYLRYGKFFTEAEEIIQPINMNSPQFLTHVADIYWNTNRVELARDLAQRAAATGDVSAVYLDLKFRLLDFALNKQWDQSLALTDEIAKLASKDSRMEIEALYQKSVVRRLQGQPAQALQLCEKVHRLAKQKNLLRSGPAFMGEMECTRALIDLKRWPEARKRLDSMLWYTEQFPMFQGFLKYHWHHERLRILQLSQGPTKERQQHLSAMRALIEQGWLGKHYIANVEMWESFFAQANEKEKFAALTKAFGRHSDYVKDFRDLRNFL